MTINVFLTLYKGGNIEEFLQCEVQDLDEPLLVMLSATVHGLSVAYEVYDEAALLSKAEHKTGSDFMKTVSELSSLLPPSRYGDTTQGKKSIKGKVDLKDREKDMKLHDLDFMSCSINKMAVRKFVIRNNSGIKAPFNLLSKNFNPVKYLDQVSPPPLPAKDSTLMSETPSSQRSHAKDSEVSATGRVVKFAISTRSKSSMLKKKKVYELNHALLTETYEQANKFASATGETYTATRRAEQEQHFYLENNKGIALVCSPYKGELAPHSEVVITVSCYNNVCGKYEDIIISDVKGLHPVEIPVSISIKGSPIYIPSNQVGVYFNEDPPALVMKPTVLNGGQVSKTFKIKNTGIQDIVIDWRIYDMQAQAQKEQPLGDLFKVSIAKTEGTAQDLYKLELEAVEPETESLNSPFSIIPKNFVISSKEKATFEVKFDTNRGLGTFNSVLLAHPQLDKSELKENEVSPNLGVIYLTLRGEVVPAHLTIDKRKRMDDKHYTQFEVWSSSDMPDDSAPPAAKALNFVNMSPADITFTASTVGPFELVGTKTNAPPHPLAKPAMSLAKSKKGENVAKVFTLLPGTFFEALCKITRPDPSDLASWPEDMRIKKAGALKLSYSNGTEECVELEANLLRPKVCIYINNMKKDELADDEFDFGTVYIDKEREKIITAYLRNESKAVAKWQLNHVKILPKSVLGHKTITRLEKENIDKTDDSAVFAFSVTEGHIHGPSDEVSWMPQGHSVAHFEKDEFDQKYQPTKLSIKFMPTKPLLYKSKFQITVANGISCEITLKGKGEIKDVE